MIPILRARNIHVRYGGRTFLDISHLALAEGEVLVAIGPNGAGKSTLLRVLAALQRPQSGQLYFREQRISWRRALAYRRHIAVVLQDPLLLSMTVYRNVALGLYLRGLWGKRVRERVFYWLEQFQVAPLAGRPAHALSGGEAQRVALARAFVLEPDILFLDEPFSGLDMPTRLDILADLRRVLQATGMTTFLVTHDRDEALALADRVVVLFEGHIRQIGSVDDVFSRPVDEQTAAFVGVENRVPAHVIARLTGRCQVELAGGGILWARVDAPEGERCLVCVRPEDILLTTGEDDPSEALTGQVKQTILLGTQVRIIVTVGQGDWYVLISRSTWRRLGLHEGDRVRLIIPPENVHLLLTKESSSKGEGKSVLGGQSSLPAAPLSNSGRKIDV